MAQKACFIKEITDKLDFIKINICSVKNNVR